MINRWLPALFIGLFFIGSCSFFGNNQPADGAQPLAKVGNDFLYQDDIESIKFATTREDSIALIRGYIKNWVAEKLLMEKATENLPEGLVDIDKRVKDYRESLIIYTYEQELIRQKIDTAIGIEEVRQYYNDYRSNFELESDVFNIRYVKMLSASFSKDSVYVWFRSLDLEERLKLEDFCTQFAVSYLIADSNWMSEDWVLDNLPVSKSTLARPGGMSRTERVEEEEYLYFIQVIDKANQGEIAPLDYVFDDIRKIILNKRKILLIENMYKKIYEEGENDEKFVIY